LAVAAPDTKWLARQTEQPVWQAQALASRALIAALRGDSNNSLLSPRELQIVQLVAACLCLADPAHHTDVVLPEPVFQDRLGGIDVDPLASQQRPDAGRSGRAEVAQPVLLLGFVGRHDLL